MSIRRFLLAASLLLTWLPAHAQNLGSWSGSDAEAGAQAGASAGSSSYSQGGSALSVGQGGQALSTSEGGKVDLGLQDIGGESAAAANIQFGDTNYDLSKSVPGMWAPGLGGGGSNPCVVSASGAGAGSGFGISLGGSWNDDECQVREHLRIMGGQLNKDSREAQAVQKAIACQSDMLRKAMQEAAEETGDSRIACLEDRKERQQARQRARRAAPREETQTASRPVGPFGF